jgi:hypothetical protein
VFGDAWRKRERLVSIIDITYPYSLLRDGKGRPELAEHVCACLQALVGAGPTLLSDQAPAEWFLPPPESEPNLQEQFHEQIVLPG